MTLSKRILTVILAFFLFISILVFVIEASSKDTQNPINNSAKTPTEADANAEMYLYRITEYNGKIAVFSQNGKTPLYVLESPYVRDLPPYDQELLRAGITVESNTKLLEILEDYDN